jgi:pre-60S factor REI1
MSFESSATNLLTCSACAIEFEDHSDHRDHFKQEWHVYNTKRRVAGLQPISETVWEEKLEKIRSQQVSVQTQLAASRSPEQSASMTSPKPKKEFVPPLCDEKTCFFDNSRYESLEETLAHMSSHHSFFIPYFEWVSDWPGLMKSLCERIIMNHQCITCAKKFRSAIAVQGHMADSGHTRINLDDEDFLGDIEGYYDFSMKDDVMEELDFLEDGSVLLPSGNVLTHRDYAYIYKQKIREERRRPRRVNEKPSLPALLNVGPNGGDAGALLPAYTLKRLAKQLSRHMKEQRDKEALRVGVRNNKTMRRSYRSSIVEMYSYGK